jgi:hypothetical protein
MISIYHYELSIYIFPLRAIAIEKAFPTHISGAIIAGLEHIGLAGPGR